MHCAIITLSPAGCNFHNHAAQRLLADTSFHSAFRLTARSVFYSVHYPTWGNQASLFALCATSFFSTRPKTEIKPGNKVERNIKLAT
jgi:hypothetical protein